MDMDMSRARSQDAANLGGPSECGAPRLGLGRNSPARAPCEPSEPSTIANNHRWQSYPAKPSTVTQLSLIAAITYSDDPYCLILLGAQHGFVTDRNEFYRAPMRGPVRVSDCAYQYMHMGCM